MYKVETTINDYKYIENVTIKVYRVCANGKEDLLRECNMIAL